MPAYQRRRKTAGPKSAGNQLAQLAIPENHSHACFSGCGVVQNMQCGCERLCEHGEIVDQTIGDAHQATLGNRESFGEGARTAQNPQDCSSLAVVPIDSAARAVTAARIDVSHDPRSDETAVIRLEHLAYELVSRHPAKVHITAGELQIRIADASNAHRHERFPWEPPRFRVVGNETGITVENESTHSVHNLDDSAGLATNVMQK